MSKHMYLYVLWLCHKLYGSVDDMKPVKHLHEGPLSILISNYVKFKTKGPKCIRMSVEVYACYMQPSEILSQGLLNCQPINFHSRKSN